MHWDRFKRITYGFDIRLLVNRLDFIFKPVSSLRSVDVNRKITQSGPGSYQFWSLPGPSILC